MALTLFRRHTKKCTQQYTMYDRAGKDCRCIIQVEGSVGDQFIRESTGTRAWSQALAMVKKAERLGFWERPRDAAPATSKSLAEAVEEFLADCASPQGKNLAKPTLVKYRTVLNGLVQFCTDRGVSTFDQVNFAALQAYRRTWRTQAHASANNIARLRTFWDFAVKSEYAEANVAKELDMPKDYQKAERIPYSDEEMTRILEAARTMELDPQQRATNEEIETFILVQRYAGLAIADTALLQASGVRGDEIRYRRKKRIKSSKQQLVVVPLPAFVIGRLKRLPLQHGKYYFCHGSTVLQNAVEAWRVRLEKVFEVAGITEDPGSHRFRHTFATALLTLGVSIELVSRWLGHNSVKITEQHYSHFLEDRIQAASNVLRDLYANAS